MNQLDWCWIPEFWLRIVVLEKLSVRVKCLNVVQNCHTSLKVPALEDEFVVVCFSLPLLRIYSCDPTCLRVQLILYWFLKVSLCSCVVSITQHDWANVCHACPSMLMVFIELSELAEDLCKVEKGIILVARRRRFGCMVESFNDLIECKMQFIKFFGRLLVRKLKRNAQIAFFRDFL